MHYNPTQIEGVRQSPMKKYLGASVVGGECGGECGGEVATKKKKGWGVGEKTFLLGAFWVVV